MCIRDSVHAHLAALERLEVDLRAGLRIVESDHGAVSYTHLAALNLDLIASRHTQKKARTSPDKSF